MIPAYMDCPAAALAYAVAGKFLNVRTSDGPVN